MPCVLQILGETFDPSTIPELATLQPFAEFRRGDPNPSGAPGFTEVGGLTCEVSPRLRMIDLVEQSTAYLVRHQDLLIKLRDVDAVKYRTITFHISPKEFAALESRIMIPPLLLKLCAGVNLGVSLLVH
jgi:hypothetical protein